MALTPETAAKVARAAGLSLADAAAIRALADTEDQAHKIAADFAGTSKADKDSTAFVQALFGDQYGRQKIDLGPTPDGPTAA